MFELCAKWKARHAEFAATIHRAVEERMRQAGVSGPASAATHSPEVSITRIDADEYGASASVGLAFDAEYGLAYHMDVDTGELEF